MTEIKNIAKLTSYGSYLDCEFTTAKYPNDEVHIVGDLAEYVYDLEHQLAEKDKEIERLKANQTPTRKRLTPINWDKYNLADKLRYRNRQVKEALIRLSNMNEMEDVLRSQLKDQRHQICEKIKEKLDNVCFDNCKDGDTPYYLNWCVKIKDVKQILDQIEKGE